MAVSKSDGGKSPDKIFRIVSSRCEAFRRNALILTPFILLALLAHYWIFVHGFDPDGPAADSAGSAASAGSTVGKSPDHGASNNTVQFAAYSFAIAEIVSIVSPFISCNVLASVVFMPVVSLACTVYLEYRWWFFVILWMVSVTSIGLFFLVILEFVAFCPSTWELLVFVQDAVYWNGPLGSRLAELIRSFLPDDIIIEEEEYVTVNDNDVPVASSGTNAENSDVAGHGLCDTGHEQSPKQRFKQEPSPSNYPGNALLKRIQAKYDDKDLFRKFVCMSMKTFAVFREICLLPVVIFPFLIDPYFSRYVNKSGRGLPIVGTSMTYQNAGNNIKEQQHPRHYLFVLHGSGANTGQWILGRLMLTVRGYADYTFFANYLIGFSHTKSDGDVDKLASKLWPSMLKQILSLQTPSETPPNREGPSTSEGKYREGESFKGAAPIYLTVFGHSLGADLTVELTHRLYSTTGSRTGNLASTTGNDPCQDDGMKTLFHFHHIISLSGPFRGARILTILKHILPQFIFNYLFGEAPDTDFMEGSPKAKELTRYVHEEVVITNPDVTFWDGHASLIRGGCDFIVTPESGLCICKNTDKIEYSPVDSGSEPAGQIDRASSRDDSSSWITNLMTFAASALSSRRPKDHPSALPSGAKAARDVPRKKRFLYMEDVGHYSVVGADVFWRRFLDLVVKNE